MAATGTITSPWNGAMLFQGDDTSGLQVFNISGNDLSTVNTPSVFTRIRR
jgi:choice-of-anchor A domain-containing protein